MIFCRQPGCKISVQSAGGQAVDVAAYVGVDVQAARGCPYVILDAALHYHSSGWLHDPKKLSEVVSDTTKTLGPRRNGGQIFILDKVANTTVSF